MYALEDEGQPDPHALPLGFKGIALGSVVGIRENSCEHYNFFGMSGRVRST